MKIFTRTVDTVGNVETIVEQEEFISAEQTITSAGLLTLAHGLGLIPGHVMIELVCKIAEDGFSIGDIVDWDSSNQQDGTAGDKGIVVVKDATNIRVRFGSDAACLKLLQFDTGDGSVITNANWKVVVRARP